MARIAGVNIPLNKRVEIGLTTIYGVGLSTAQKVLDETKISPDTYVKDLTDDEISRLRDAIDNDLTVEGDLRRERSQDVKRLTEIGADKETPVFGDLGQALRDYEARNKSRTKVWLRHFANDVVRQT